MKLRISNYKLARIIYFILGEIVWLRILRRGIQMDKMEGISVYEKDIVTEEDLKEFEEMGAKEEFPRDEYYLIQLK